MLRGRPWCFQICFKKILTRLFAWSFLVVACYVADYDAVKYILKKYWLDFLHRALWLSQYNGMFYSVYLLLWWHWVKVVFAVLNTSIYTENTNAYGRKKKEQKESPELSRPGDAKECANPITQGNANTNSNPLAPELAAEPQL